MRNNTRLFARLASLTLALVLVLSLPAGVFAAESGETDSLPPETSVSIPETTEAEETSEAQPESAVESAPPDASDTGDEVSTPEENDSSLPESSSTAPEPVEEPTPDSLPVSQPPVPEEEPEMDVQEEAEEPVLETASEEGSFTYELVDGGIKLTSYLGKTPHLTIPASIKGYPVKVIGSKAFNTAGSSSKYRFLESVIIPDTVVSIEGQAFIYCDNLKKVTLSSNLKHIGFNAFKRCDIRELHIPASLTEHDSISGAGAGPFAGNSNLKKVTFAPGTTVISEGLLSDTGLESVVIPEGVTTLEFGAFRNCEQLTSVSLPNSLTTIYAGVFAGCTSLPAVTLPPNLKFLGYEAFNRCESLTSIHIPKSLVETSSITATLGVFNNSGLTSATFEEGLPLIVDGLFKGTPLTSAVLPDSVAKIGSQAFAACPNLRTVSVLEGTKISSDAFKNSPNVQMEYRRPPVVRVRELRLNMAAKDMRKGQKVQLKATVLPANATNKKVTFTSSKPGVAAVTGSGQVTAKANGTAVITAAADGRTAKCTIRVNAKYTPVSRISLSASSLRLAAKGSYSLKATVAPAKASNKKVLWRSSDSRVATVSAKGVVKAVGQGSATITATSAEGGKTRSCRVTVVDTKVASLKLNRTKATLNKGRSLTLKATVKPGAAAKLSISWSSSRPKVATVDSKGRVKAVGRGSAVITATVGGKRVRCTVRVP